METKSPPAKIGMPLEMVDTPALLIDLDAFEHNLNKMSDTVSKTGVRLRPHAKTHKCPIIALRQMALGAVGICCQKVAEAEAMVYGGVTNVLVTNEIVGKSKIERLASLARQAKVGVCADDPFHVKEYGAVAQSSGVDLDVYGGATEDGSRVRSEFGLSADDVLITCIGRFSRRKNQKLLLDAWKCLPGSLANAHLLLVGGGPRLPAIEHELDLWRHLPVHIAGYRSDIPSILKATDVLVLPSRYEGLPRCVMEAMAAGKPVVATNVRGSRDLIEHGSNGLLVEPENSAEFAEALIRLIRDPALRNRMGKRGREMIKDCALDLVLDEMWRIYDRFRQVGIQRAIRRSSKD